MSEKNEDLKELLKQEDDKIFNRQIQKKMEKKLSKVIYTRIGLLVLAIILFVGVVDLGFKQSNYNPNKEDIGFEPILKAYVQTFYPGIMYYGINFEDDEYYTIDKHFGNYEFDMQIYGYDATLKLNNIVNKKVYINQSVIDFSNVPGMFLTNDEYVDVEKTEAHNKNLIWNDEDRNKLIQDLNHLPDSVVIEAKVSFNKKKNLKETIDFINQYPNSNTYWLAMEQYEYVQFLNVGIHLNEYAFSGDIKEYPDFSTYDYDKKMQKELTPEFLKNHYLDTLKILVDHKEAYSLFNKNMLNTNYEHLTNQYEFAKKQQNCIGARMTTNKKDLIDMLEKDIVNKVNFDDIRLSVYSK